VLEVYVSFFYQAGPYLVEKMEKMEKMANRLDCKLVNPWSLAVDVWLRIAALTVCLERQA
jgi:hypothetical protein